MNTTLLQNKIESLQIIAGSLLNIDMLGSSLYIDDLARLNGEIHERIVALSFLKGNTVEQEALLCLAILSGYSVIIYANPEDEIRKKSVLERAGKIVEEALPMSLKCRLLAICGKF